MLLRLLLLGLPPPLLLLLLPPLLVLLVLQELGTCAHHPSLMSLEGHPLLLLVLLVLTLLLLVLLVLALVLLVLLLELLLELLLLLLLLLVLLLVLLLELVLPLMLLGLLLELLLVLLLELALLLVLVPVLLLLTRFAWCATTALLLACLCPSRTATAPCLCRRLRRCPTLVWLGVPCCTPPSWSAGLRRTGGSSGTSQRAAHGASLTLARRLAARGLPFGWRGVTTRRDPGWRPTTAITISRRSASRTRVTLQTGRGSCSRLLGRGRTAGARARAHAAVAGRAARDTACASRRRGCCSTFARSMRVRSTTRASAGRVAYAVARVPCRSRRRGWLSTSGGTRLMVSGAAPLRCVLMLGARLPLAALTRPSCVASPLTTSTSARSPPWSSWVARQRATSVRSWPPSWRLRGRRPLTRTGGGLSTSFLPPCCAPWGHSRTGGRSSPTGVRCCGAEAISRSCGAVCARGVCVGVVSATVLLLVLPLVLLLLVLVVE